MKKIDNLDSKDIKILRLGRKGEVINVDLIKKAMRTMSKADAKKRLEALAARGYVDRYFEGDEAEYTINAHNMSCDVYVAVFDDVLEDNIKLR